MAITASQITVAQNPVDPDGTVVSFTRSDTMQQVVIPIPIQWSGIASAELGEVKTAIQQWESEQNAFAAANAAVAGVTV